MIILSVTYKEADFMNPDEYWNKFISDGKVESYLNYKEHLKTQDSVIDGNNAVYNRRPDNQGEEYR